MAILVPNSYASASYSFIKSSGALKSEEWLSDGSLKVEIELNSGMKGSFLDRIGSLTKGTAQVKE
jgi:ribosome maturation protein SDO1